MQAQGAHRCYETILLIREMSFLRAPITNGSGTTCVQRLRNGRSYAMPATFSNERISIWLTRTTV